MNLDKEREEFESYEHSKKPCAYKDQLFARFEASDLDVDEHKYIGEYFNSAMQEKWELWQAAKAQVVPYGYCVVPNEATEAITNAFYANIDDGAHAVYLAILEAAQE